MPICPGDSGPAQKIESICIAGSGDGFGVEEGTGQGFRAVSLLVSSV